MWDQRAKGTNVKAERLSIRILLFKKLLTAAEGSYDPTRPLTHEAVVFLLLGAGIVCGEKHPETVFSAGSTWVPKVLQRFC